MKNKYGVGPDAMEHTMQILVDEVKTLGAQRDALLAALKDALPLIYHDADTPRLSRAISILEVARAKAEGRDPSPWEMEEAHE